MLTSCTDYAGTKMPIDNSAKYSDFCIPKGSSGTSKALFHVTHIESAVSILQNKELCSRKIADDPRLVDLFGIWLTPNHWRDGSFYGNIRFAFNLATIINAYQFYWIGVSEWFSERTCNFVISNRRLESAFFHSYNIEQDDGPLRFRDGNFEWNLSVNIHIIHDGSIKTDDLCDVVSIDHHTDKCMLKKACPKFGKDSAERLLIARCLRDIEKIPELLIAKTDSVRKFCEYLYSLVSYGVNYQVGGMTGTDNSSLALAKEIVDQYSMSTCETDLAKCIALSERFHTALSARSAIDLYIQRYIGDSYIIQDRETEWAFGTGYLLI